MSFAQRPLPVVAAHSDLEGDTWEAEAGAGSRALAAAKSVCAAVLHPGAASAGVRRKTCAAQRGG
jgi:hypothetical protein